jgi:hypothetical protein
VYFAGEGIAMAIFRTFHEAKGTVVLTYKGEPITPELKVNDPKQLLEGLSAALERAYQKIRDSGIE